MTRIRKSYRVDANADAMKRASSASVITVDSGPVSARHVRRSMKAEEAAAASNTGVSSGSAGAMAEVVAWPEESIDPVDDDDHSDTSGAEPTALHFCTFIVRFPKLAFGLTLSGHLIMLGVSILLLALGKDVFPAVFDRIPFDLKGQDVTNKYWAWTSRGDSRYVIRRVPWTFNTWERGTASDNMQLMYNRQGGNLFEKIVLQQIKAMEDKLLSEGEYKKSLCQLEKDGTTCVPPRSILRYFDGSMAHINPVFNDTEFDNIPGVVWEASHNERTKSQFDYFLGNKTVINRDGVYTDYTRSEMFIGFPISHVQSFSQFVGMTLFEKVEPEIQRVRAQVAPEVTYAAPLNWSMFTKGAAVYGIHDILLVVGSVIFIFLYMWLQTGSFFVTYWAVFSIVTSFFGTNLIYRYILDFRYFGYFHLIAMFIILGIGADDIFVFFNTWKASALENHRTAELRLSAVYRRAAVSMFVTSFTTTVAFFVTSFTPIITGRSFGIFTGVLVIVNYLSVVVFFPTVVYMYHLYLEDRYACLPCAKPLARACCRGCRNCRNQNSAQPDTNAESARVEESTEEAKAQPGLMMRFFSGPYMDFITHYVWRWVIIVFFLVMLVFFAWSTSTLTPDSEQIMIFKENTKLGRGWKYFFTAFKPTDVSQLNTNIVWGLRPRDPTNCHFSDIGCRGVPVFDESFDINIPSVQLGMRDLCRKIKYNLTDEQFKELHIRKNSHGEAEVQCFMDYMERFLQEEQKRLSKICKNTPLDLSFPLTETKVQPFMQCLSSCVYNTSKLSQTFHRYFEIVMSYWLTNRYTMVPTYDFKLFNSLLGEGRDGENTHIVEYWNMENLTSNCNISLQIPSNINIGKIPKDLKPLYGTKLKFATIPVNLSSNFLGMGYANGLPIYDKWEKFLGENLPTLPHGMRLAMQTNSGMWHWLFVQEALVKAAVNGVALGIGLALPVLILATRNFLIGGVSTVVIMCICVCVVGVIPLPGWKLGMLVSINLCLVVGLSIDYIVHMAEAYHMSEQTDRREKVRDMLAGMASSVVAGATTTLGASFFMFFGKTQFFLQFAAFMFSTIGFSVLFSLGFFPTVMALCGPIGLTGSLLPVWQCFKNCFTGRKRSDVDCANCSGKGFHPGHQLQHDTVRMCSPIAAISASTDAEDAAATAGVAVVGTVAAHTDTSTLPVNGSVRSVKTADRRLSVGVYTNPGFEADAPTTPQQTGSTIGPLPLLVDIEQQSQQQQQCDVDQQVAQQQQQPPVQQLPLPTTLYPTGNDEPLQPTVVLQTKHEAIPSQQW